VARVYASTVVDAPIAQVWAVLRDFNGHDRWHPAIAASRIEDGAADRIGAVRRFRLADGSELREQLLSLSDRDHAFRYCLLASPLPLMGYVAQVRLRPVTDGNRTFWEWSSEFQPPAGRTADLVSLVRDGIYRAGFAAIRGLLAPGNAATGPVLAVEKPAAPAVMAQSQRTRAIVVAAYGGPEVLQLREVDLPPPGPGQVQIRHGAIGVNFIDVYCRTGYFALLTPPGTPGMEAAGVIEAVGEGVAGIAPGDRVAYACPPVGAYAERRNMDPALLVHLGADIPDRMAAASLLKGVSASFLLHDVTRVAPGMVVLVPAAAGGIGQILVQWARHLGARVIATAGGPDKVALVQRLGADHVIDYRAEDFAPRVLALTEGRGADVVFDSAGASSFAGSLAALATRGHLVSFGQAAGPVGAVNVDALSAKSVTLSRPNYAHYTDTPDRLAPQVARFFGAVRAGHILLAPPAVYPLDRAADAHRDLESRRTTGALVLEP
jgi:NADPH:quinone reductase